MKDIAIRVDNLSKRYRIGRAQQRHDTLRDALAAAFKRSNVPTLQRSNDEDHIWALKDVSFEVKRGEVVGIIGRNGAGKSTLLKILSRITEPTEGRAELHGRVGSLLEVGTGFHPELTGRENIYLSGAILGMRREEIDRRFDEIVTFAEIQRFLDTPVKRYSSGMYVRLGFSIAAHTGPSILLVDEVLAVGDSRFWSKSIDKMRALNAMGMTILLVTHNMWFVQTVCTRAICLDRGSIAVDGSPLAAIVRYREINRDADNGNTNDNFQRGTTRTREIGKLGMSPLVGESEVLPGDGIRLSLQVGRGERLHGRVFIRVTSVDGFPYFTVHSNDLLLDSNDILRCEARIAHLMLRPGDYRLWAGICLADVTSHVVAQESIPLCVSALPDSIEAEGAVWNTADWDLNVVTHPETQL